MKKSKLKVCVIAGAIFALLFAMGGCSGQGDNAKEEKSITVISRESGSGTRDAFTELTGVMEDDVDRTVSSAEISNSTAVVIQSVAGNDAAIGYVSMGSMSDDVTAAKVDGVEATVDNVKTGDYKLQRPFNVVTKGDVDKLTEDFLSFVMSQQGKEIIEEEGYIFADAETGNDAANIGGEYSAAGLKGTITIAGSTSVAPVMEVLADEYKGLNKGVEIEIQQNGSSAGIQSTLEGVCDLGMASRELKSEETNAGLTSMPIALDGIAVIVNNGNPITDLSMDQIKAIYVGDIVSWSELL